MGLAARVASPPAWRPSRVVLFCRPPIPLSRRGRPRPPLLLQNEARLRMALLPAPAEVLFSPGLWVPLVNLQGVFILPGIPRLLQTMIQTHIGRFTGPSFHEDAVYTQMGEGGPRGAGWLRRSHAGLGSVELALSAHAAAAAAAAAAHFTRA